MPKQARISGIKAYRTYTPDEAANVTGVSTRTIRNWMASGLLTMTNARPVLIRGDDLRDFINAQRKARKIDIGQDQLYCCVCKVGRGAAGGIADCDIRGLRASLTALCNTCETVMTKPIVLADVQRIGQSLDLTIRRHE